MPRTPGFTGTSAVCGRRGVGSCLHCAGERWVLTPPTPSSTMEEEEAGAGTALAISLSTGLIAGV